MNTQSIMRMAAVDKEYMRAIQEHAFLMRTEGLTQKQIGERLGINQTSVRGLYLRFGQRLARGMRKTLFSGDLSPITDDPQENNGDSIVNENMHRVTFETVTCTVHNPLKHPRSIYDGLSNSERIWLEPDETKENVVLAKHMADMLIARTNDLKLTDVKPAGKVKAPRPVGEDQVEDDVPVVHAASGKKGRAA